MMSAVDRERSQGLGPAADDTIHDSVAILVFHMDVKCF